MIMHTLLMIISNLVMYGIYKCEHPFFERYKISSEPWPWKTDPKEFHEKLKRTFKNLFFNSIILLPLTFLFSLYTDAAQFRIDEASYPSCMEIALQITFFMIVEDFGFYWAHRLLHIPFLYKHLHKKHHEYNITIGLAAEYSHPLEFILSNSIPTGLGSIILGSRCHIFTWYMWLFVRILETTDGHCGYEFSWSPFRLLPLSGSANYHNFHHSHNAGNFSSFFTYWDTIFQTNKPYLRHLAQQKKKEC